MARRQQDFHGLIRGVCRYLDGVGPAIGAGLYVVIDACGGEVRPGEWEAVVRPGSTFSVQLRGSSW